MTSDIRFPVIDLPATGQNIQKLRVESGFSVRDLQQFFGFEAPQAIYKWQRGQALPSVDNLFALSSLFHVPIDDILIPVSESRQNYTEQQAQACCSAFLNRLLRIRQKSVPSIRHFPCPGSSAAECSLWSGQDIKRNFSSHSFRMLIAYLTKLRDFSLFNLSGKRMGD